MMQVPFLDLPRLHTEISRQLEAAVQRVMGSCQFVSGPAVEDFERAFADYTGAYHCVGLNSGTSALHLALLATEIGPGDEVITTPLSWVSTAWAISYVGAKPVFVDVDDRTGNIAAEKIEAAITSQTRAILPVHLYGQAAEMGKIESIARGNNLLIIEDAAQAHGARWAGRHVGTIGKVGCFSFYPAKNLGACGEAGAIVTDDARIADRVRALRDHAQRTRHRHEEIGYNARMDSIQAAVLNVKLPYLDRWNDARRKHANVYLTRLGRVAGLQLPTDLEQAAHVWHLFVVLSTIHSRDRVADYLRHQGIGVALHYPTLIPAQPAYQHLGYQRGQFPNAERFADHCLSLPMHPHLTEDDMAYVGDHLRVCARDGVPAV